MTDMDRAVRRRTVNAYRVTVTGSQVDLTGRRLVVELRGDAGGDFLRIREAGRRAWVELEIAGLYRRGLLAQAAARKAERKAKRRP